MASERQQRPPLLLDLAARAVGAVAVLAAALVVGIWLNGPLRIERGALPFDLATVNPIVVLAVLAPLWLVLRWRRWRAWIGLPAGSRLSLRGVRPAAWLLLPLSVVLLGSQLRSAVGHVVPIPQMLHKSARRGPATMAINAANRHAGPLLRELVRRPDPAPVVVWIDDLDHRGHIASFYLYPRLLLMEPEQRRWSLRVRMTARGGANPLFRVGKRPSVEQSREFARERGTELVFASSARGGAKR